MTSVVKTIEVDPRVPGVRDEIPFPQAKQCSPELDSPQFSVQCPFSQNLQCLQEKPIVSVVNRENLSSQWSSADNVR